MLGLYSPKMVAFFLALHLCALGVIWTRPTAKLLLCLALTYFVRMFGITAGYHRYFAHRSYKTGRVAQFLLAFLAESSLQRGVLWWASHHRSHHRNSDKDSDPHSARQGFWWSHIGWVLAANQPTTKPKIFQEFTKFPEICWLNQWYLLPPAALALGLLTAGWPMFLWGFVISTLLLYHVTFALNSFGHMWGSRRFDTPDDSRNNLALAVLMLGDGWHNNHHHLPFACRQGNRWWEVDLTFEALRALSWIRVTKELKPYRMD